MPRCALVPAQAADQTRLDALILRSKAYWGYDADIMAIMKRVLKVDPIALQEGRVMLAMQSDQLAGVAQLSFKSGEACELDLLFVDPDAIRTGAGRTLYDWALARARQAGVSRLEILSDPYATPFYEKMGAKLIEMRPSGAVPGRELPWLVHELT